MNEKNLGYGVAAYSVGAGFASEWRDLWWNQDYLELLAARWDLGEARSLLDVGCGAGHWGQRLATVMHPEVAVTGIDHEAGFLDGARERAKGRPGSYTYLEATGERLPFEDGAFDVVTCQTVLIHVADAAAVLAEMKRVTRPGGRLVIAEPDNLANAVLYRRYDPAPNFDDLARLLALAHACCRGKRALGQGDGAVGERLPSLLTALGLTDVAVYGNDSCAVLTPPYAGSQRIQADQLIAFAEAGFALFGDRETSQRLHAAGGGDPAAFDELWALEIATQTAMVAAIAEGRHSMGGNLSMYVASGRV